MKTKITGFKFWWLPALVALMAALATFSSQSPQVAQAVTGGPVILMGIDAEDSGHGNPATVYAPIIDAGILNNVTNGGSGILAIGCPAVGSDQVTVFWTAVAANVLPVETLTCIETAGSIATQSFAGFAMIAVASDDQNTSGGLTQGELTALNGRSADVAAFINGGGGLLGFSSCDLIGPYGYLVGIGGIVCASNDYADITPTAAGTALGFTATNLDISFWHDTYTTFPSFLAPLAHVAVGQTGAGAVAAIGGSQVIVGPAAGRMTGGGTIPGKVAATHGFELHCDATKSPNNLQVNWGKGDKFHMEVLDAAKCSDDPLISEGKPVAGFDTYVGTGTGRYNGVAGHTIEFKFTDQGEPGTADTADISIFKPDASLLISFSGKITKGNQQAHP